MGNGMKVSIMGKEDIHFDGDEIVDLDMRTENMSFEPEDILVVELS